MKTTQTKRTAPGPPGLPGLGNVRDFSDDPLQDFLNLHRRYGNVVRPTLEIVTRTLFGAHLLPDEADTVAEVMPRLMHETNARIISLTNLREKLPLPSNRQFQADIARLDRILYRIIDERRRSERRRDDLLGRLMAAAHEDASVMTDRQLRDELMTIFLAGHETTAALLSWTLFLLSKHPAERRTLQAEVDRELGDRTPAAGDLQRLDFTQRTLQEALRLYPPAWSIAREAIGDDEVSGYPIPAGSGIIISPYVVHRRPDCWDNPEGFDPDRFTPERAHGRPTHAYIPFGGGPRLCIGSHFALQEAALALAMIARRYEPDLDPAYPVRAMTDFTLRPADGVWMHLRPR